VLLHKAKLPEKAPIG
jgi:hypothetical protein